MIQVVLSIGSNCGDRNENVSKAMQWLKTVLIQTRCSSVYETPCALKSGKPYLNAVMEGFYSGDGMQLESILKDKEREMGRSAQCRERGDVPIDMDIVIENGGVVKDWDYRQKFFRIGFDELHS